MRKWVLFGIFLLSGLSMSCFSQTTPEKLKQLRSTVIQTINGKDYYIHTIKRGQTLYMISKVYDVDVNAIILENPRVKEGIKADQKINIPVSDKIAKTQAQQPETLKPETLKPETLKPETQQPETLKPETQKPETQQPETLKPETLKPETQQPEPGILPVIPCDTGSLLKKAVYNVALMLPLFLEKADAIDAGNPPKDILETHPSFQFLPFYEGFRLALDSMERSGLHINLRVYDVGKDTVQTMLLLAKPEMKELDLIVGLLYIRNFLLVADFAKMNNIGLVNPISERDEILEGNPMVIKVKPSKNSLYPWVAAFLARECDNGRVLVVRNSKFSDGAALERFKSACQEKKLDVQVVEGQEAIMARMTKVDKNWLVAFSDNTANAFDITRRWYQYRSDFDISLLGLPSWENLKGLETEYLVGLKTHIVTHFFVDYDDPGVKKFVKRYQQIYKTDPAPMAFEGFDMALYFLSALKTYGKNFPACIHQSRMNLLGTVFDFKQSPGNGSGNEGWVIFKYENYKKVKAD